MLRHAGNVTLYATKYKSTVGADIIILPTFSPAAPRRASAPDIDGEKRVSAMREFDFVFLPRIVGTLRLIKVRAAGNNFYPLAVRFAFALVRTSCRSEFIGEVEAFCAAVTHCGSYELIRNNLPFEYKLIE